MHDMVWRRLHDLPRDACGIADVASQRNSAKSGLWQHPHQRRAQEAARSGDDDARHHAFSDAAISAPYISSACRQSSTVSMSCTR